MMDKIISMMKKEYRMKSVDAGVFKKLKIEGMDFAVEAYDAVGLGRVSVMRASGLLGLIKRDTLVISPLEKAIPLVTYERIQTFGKDTYILGKYDCVNPMEYTKEDGKKKQSAEYDEKIENFFQNYLKESLSAQKSEADRKSKIFEYVDDAIENAKLSTDIFMANYGEEITVKLYHEVMFGTK